MPKSKNCPEPGRNHRTATAPSGAGNKENTHALVDARTTDVLPVPGPGTTYYERETGNRY